MEEAAVQLNCEATSENVIQSWKKIMSDPDGSVGKSVQGHEMFYS